MMEAYKAPKAPKIVEEAPVKEVVEQPNLHKIPILTHYGKDAGAYITSAVISARSHDGSIENVSIQGFWFWIRSIWRSVWFQDTCTSC